MCTEAELMEKINTLRNLCHNGIQGLNGEEGGWEPDVLGFEEMIESIDEINVKITQRRMDIVDILDRLIEWDAGMGPHEASIWEDIRKLRDRFSMVAQPDYGWSEADAAVAYEAGWKIGESGGNREIQRRTDKGGRFIFPGNDDAKGHVWRLSVKGNGLHRRAVHSLVMRPCIT